MLCVQIPPEAAHFSLESDHLGCVVLLSFVVCIALLASFFLPSASLINVFIELTVECFPPLLLWILVCMVCLLPDYYQLYMYIIMFTC